MRRSFWHRGPGVNCVKFSIQRDNPCSLKGGCGARAESRTNCHIAVLTCCYIALLRMVGRDAREMPREESQTYCHFATLRMKGLAFILRFFVSEDKGRERWQRQNIWQRQNTVTLVRPNTALPHTCLS